MLTASYQDVTDSLRCGPGVLRHARPPGEFDANGDGQISADESDLLGLCCTSFGTRIQTKKRSARHGRAGMEAH